MTIKQSKTLATASQKAKPVAVHEYDKPLNYLEQQAEIHNLNLPEKAAAPQEPAQAVPMVQVTKKDGSDYCKILSLLGMEEDGDPVAEVARLLEQEQTSADKNNQYEYRGFYIRENSSAVWIAGTYNNTRLPAKTFHDSVLVCKGYIDCYLDELQSQPQQVKP